MFVKDTEYSLSEMAEEKENSESHPHNDHLHSSSSSHSPLSSHPPSIPISIPVPNKGVGKDTKCKAIKSPAKNSPKGYSNTGLHECLEQGKEMNNEYQHENSLNVVNSLIDMVSIGRDEHKEKTSSNEEIALLTEQQQTHSLHHPEQGSREEKEFLENQQVDAQNMVQCKIHEDIIMKMVETIINKRMDTIRMMVESCVNKKLKDYRKLANANVNANANANVNGFNPAISSSTSGSNIASSSYQSSSTNTRSITLSHFGTEDFRYMYMPYLSDLIKSMGDIKAVFQVVLKDLYFNPDHKENNIIFIPPNAFKTMTVFVDGIWKNYDLDVSLQNIIRRVNDVLQYYLLGNLEEDRFKTEIGKKKFDQLHSFTNQIDNMEEYPEFLTKIMQITEHTIMTHQHLVHRNLTEGNG